MVIACLPDVILHAFDFGSRAEDPLPTPSLWPDSEASPSSFLFPAPNFRVSSTVSLSGESYVHPQQTTTCMFPSPTIPGTI